MNTTRNGESRNIAATARCDNSLMTAPDAPCLQAAGPLMIADGINASTPLTVPGGCGQLTDPCTRDLLDGVGA